MMQHMASSTWLRGWCASFRFLILETSFRKSFVTRIISPWMNGLQVSKRIPNTSFNISPSQEGGKTKVVAFSQVKPGHWIACGVERIWFCASADGYSKCYTKFWLQGHNVTRKFEGVLEILKVFINGGICISTTNFLSLY